MSGAAALLNTVFGFDSFRPGQEEIVDAVTDGRNVLALQGAEARAWQSQCAMIFQQFNLVDRLDVLSNVLVGRLADHGFLTSMAMRWPSGARLRRAGWLPLGSGRRTNLPVARSSRIATRSGPCCTRAAM